MQRRRPSSRLSGTKMQSREDGECVEQKRRVYLDREYGPEARLGENIRMAGRSKQDHAIKSLLVSIVRTLNLR